MIITVEFKWQNRQVFVPDNVYNFLQTGNNLCIMYIKMNCVCVCVCVLNEFLSRSSDCDKIWYRHRLYLWEEDRLI